MDVLRSMRVFAQVVSAGSFAGAARALDLAPAAVTRLVADLEEHLCARLLNRTTRRLALTEVGEAYLERARHILADVDDAEAMTSAWTHEPRGSVRLRLPPALAVHQLARHLPDFFRRYPRITLDVLAEGPVHTVDDACDLTVVMASKSLDGQFIARRLARSEVVACASPIYLDRRGRPTHPLALKDHDALIPPVSDLERGITWYRVGPGEGPSVVTLEPRRGVLRTLHAELNHAAALSGLGIVGLPSFALEHDLIAGRLERVLPEWRLFSTTLWACMPSRRHVPLRTRALLDFLVEVFGGEDLDPWLTSAIRAAALALTDLTCEPAQKV